MTKSRRAVPRAARSPVERIDAALAYRHTTAPAAGCPRTAGVVGAPKGCPSVPVQDEQELGHAVVGERAEHPVPLGSGDAPVGEGDRDDPATSMLAASRRAESGTVTVRVTPC